jgi:hypothetical protein
MWGSMKRRRGVTVIAGMALVLSLGLLVEGGAPGCGREGLAFDVPGREDVSRLELGPLACAGGDWSRYYGGAVLEMGTGDVVHLRMRSRGAAGAGETTCDLRSEPGTFPRVRGRLVLGRDCGEVRRGRLKVRPAGDGPTIVLGATDLVPSPAAGPRLDLTFCRARMPTLRDERVLEVADFDGDGRDDLLCEERKRGERPLKLWRTRISLLTHAGAGPEEPWGQGWERRLVWEARGSIGPFSRVATADVNADGLRDVLIRESGIGIDDRLVVMLNEPGPDGTGPFTRHLVFEGGGSILDGLCVLDRGADQRPDAVMTANSETPSHGSKQTLVVLRDSAEGGGAAVAFEPCLTIDLPTKPLAVIPGDLDGDGREDLTLGFFPTLGGQPGSVMFYLERSPVSGSGPARFDLGGGFSLTHDGLLDVLDLNGDGAADVVVRGFPSGGEAGVFWYENVTEGGGSLAFSPEVELPAAALTRRFITEYMFDLNADGRPDLARLMSPGRISVLLNITEPGESALRFSGPAGIPIVRGGGDDLDAGDVNGDGKPDLVVTRRGGRRTQILIGQ